MNLEKLDLSNNVIKSFSPRVFLPTVSLTLADASGNEIKVLEPFEGLNLAQTELNFDRNELICDCGLRKFNEWVKAGPDEMKIISNCFSPEVFFGQNIVALEQEDFCSPEDITTTTVSETTTTTIAITTTTRTTASTTTTTMIYLPLPPATMPPKPFIGYFFSFCSEYKNIFSEIYKRPLHLP